MYVLAVVSDQRLVPAAFDLFPKTRGEILKPHSAVALAGLSVVKIVIA